MQWLVAPAGRQERLPLLADLDQAECEVRYHGNRTALAPVTSVPPAQFLCRYDSHCFSLCMCCDFIACDCRMQVNNFTLLLSCAFKSHSFSKLYSNFCF